MACCWFSFVPFVTNESVIPAHREEGDIVQGHEHRDDWGSTWGLPTTAHLRLPLVEQVKKDTGEEGFGLLWR